MGCLNSDQSFSHWFGNIHLSGPCNRSCYFCIGQHMMALDSLNNLDTWPLPGFEEFLSHCDRRGVSEVNLTGTNTEPLLYKHIDSLTAALRDWRPGVKLGLRTNGAISQVRATSVDAFDKISISVHSLNQDIYTQMMGSGYVPLIDRIVTRWGETKDLKINVVLGPENTAGKDILATILKLEGMGIRKVNIREPYGQPHIGDVLKAWGFEPIAMLYGMPVYRPFDICDVVYWDVHFVEVESVNLYANGRVSETYPITKGHHETGDVRGQEHFVTSGRVREQWLNA